MVGRRKTLTPAVIVDFDGTMIAGNSLYLYLRIGALSLMKRGKLIRAIRLGWTVFLRLMRLSSHRRMKETAYELIGEIDISRPLRDMYRKNITELIGQYQARGYNILVASAAYSFYLRGAVDHEFVASQPGEPECRGLIKRSKVGEWLDKNGSQAAVVITDHYDDIPLMSIPELEKVYLVTPSTRTVEKCTAHGIQFEIL